MVWAVRERAKVVNRSLCTIEPSIITIVCMSLLMDIDQINIVWFNASDAVDGCGVDPSGSYKSSSGVDDLVYKSDRRSYLLFEY